MLSRLYTDQLSHITVADELDFLTASVKRPFCQPAGTLLERIDDVMAELVALSGPIPVRASQFELLADAWLAVRSLRSALEGGVQLDMHV